MIRYICRHSRGPGAEGPILSATVAFVRPDQVVAGYADGELCFQPAHRTGCCRRLTDKMSIPQPPIQIGTFRICGVNRLAWRLLQSCKYLLLAAVNYILLDMNHLSVLSCLVHRGISKIRIYPRSGFLGVLVCLSAPPEPVCETVHQEPGHNEAVHPRQTTAYLCRGRSGLYASVEHPPIRVHRSRT